MNTIGIILAAALVFGLFLLYFVFKASGSSKSGRLDKKVIQSKWQNIELLMSQGNPANFSTAVMEADKLFDYVLRGIVGDKDKNMGERLKLAQKKFSSWDIYSDVWKAHRVRNDVAHKIHYELHAPIARKAIGQFRKGLRDLRVL